MVLSELYTWYIQQQQQLLQLLLHSKKRTKLLLIQSLKYTNGIMSVKFKQY